MFRFLWHDQQDQLIKLREEHKDLRVQLLNVTASHDVLKSTQSNHTEYAVKNLVPLVHKLEGQVKSLEKQRDHSLRLVAATQQ